MEIFGIKLDKGFLKTILIIGSVYLYFTNLSSFRDYSLLISISVTILTGSIGIIAILVLENVFRKIEKVRSVIIENIEKKIEDSLEIEKKLSFDKLEEKIGKCEDRITLYSELDRIKKRNMIKSAGISALLMLITIIEILFLKITPKYLSATSLLLFFIGGLIFVALIIDLVEMLSYGYHKKSGFEEGDELEADAKRGEINLKKRGK
jgi:hypothetical protein